MTHTLFSADLVVPAMRDAVLKLDPRQLVRNPVLFTTAIVALLLTVLLALGGERLSVPFQTQLIVWLWLTVLFGTFAEAIAEGRGRAQAASLRAAKSELKAKLLVGVSDIYEIVGAAQLRRLRVQPVGTNGSAAEVAATYSRDERIRAIACRVEQVATPTGVRWQVVALHIG